MKKHQLLFVIASMLFTACNWGNLPEKTEIETSELESHVSYLASDKLQGRKTGTPGDTDAAAYIMTELKKAGLSKFDGGYYQKLNVVTDIKTGEGNAFTAGDFEAEIGNDYVPLAFSGNTTLEAPVVFAGYGFTIDNGTLKRNDYQGIDAIGKWVMVLRADPELDNNRSAFIPYSKDRSKILAAKDAQAAGVLFVSGTALDKKDVLTKLSPGRELSQETIPVVHISRQTANRILAASGKTIEELETQLSNTEQLASFDTETVLKATIETVKIEAKTQNVVAYIEGSDPVLRNEYVVLGAHYDHLGMGGENSGSRRPDTVAVHNGADDNASGVSVLIETAEKLAAQKDSLKRSVVVIAFAAEEMGLLGSKFFAQNPLIDLKAVQAMINLDMVGRLDTTIRVLSASGTGTSPVFEELLNSVAQEHVIEIVQSPEGFGPSDHASFYTADIPVLFFSTGGHSDYHTPNDDVEFLNINGMKTVGEMTFQLTKELANLDERIDFQLAGPKERKVQGRGLKVRLGIMPAHADNNNKGLKIEAVSPGGPAHNGKLLRGDIIVALNDMPVQNIYDYMARLQTLKPGMIITVDVIRDGKKMTFIVEL